MTIYEQDDWYELQEDNEQIARDEAWEEYLSTGIDPTGGELGPDFDPATGEPLEAAQQSAGNPWDEWGRRMDAAIDAKMAEVDAYEKARREAAARLQPGAPKKDPPKQPKRGDSLLILCICLFIVGCIVGVVQYEKKEKARADELQRIEAEQRQKDQAQQKELNRILSEPVKTPEEIEAEKQAIREEVKQLLNSGRGLYGQGVTPSVYSGSTKPAKSTLPQRGTAYGDGYWAGYDEGFDDADGHNSYGFKYDETTSKYKGDALSNYVRGYRKGYKEGWNEGIEQLQDRYDNGDDELDEEEY